MIKKNFKLDKSGKSKAFFYKQYLPYINKNFLNFLKKIIKKKKYNFRICLHKDKSDKLHNMINIMYKKNKQKFHKHKFKDEIYHSIYGKTLVTILIKSKTKKIILDSKNPILRVNKNIFHLVEPISKFSIIHEMRIGPFKKNDSINL